MRYDRDGRWRLISFFLSFLAFGEVANDSGEMETQARVGMGV